DLAIEIKPTSYIEYISELQRKLASSQEAALNARCELLKRQESTVTNIYNDLNSNISHHEIKPNDSPNFLSCGDPEAEEFQDLIDLEEKVALYKDLLAPMRNTVFADPEKIFKPHSIGLLSRWPWYDVMKDWLCEILRLVRGEIDDELEKAGKIHLPFERYIINLLHEVPLPPPGKLELCINIGRLNLYCSRPPVNTISTLQNFSLYPLFRSLSPTNIVTLLELALSERKIIFLSSHCSMLTLATECLCLLFFPLTWQHILIPVLPAKLMSYLQAPMPYIVGVQRDYFTCEADKEWRPTDACIIDLDYDKITLNERPPQIPSHDRKKLIYRISKNVSNCASIYSSNILSAQQNGKLMKGVPITCQFAFPFGKSVPSCCQSARKDKQGRPTTTNSSENSLNIFSPNEANILGGTRLGAKTKSLGDQINRLSRLDLSGKKDLGSTTVLSAINKLYSEDVLTDLYSPKRETNDHEKSKEHSRDASDTVSIQVDGITSV
ncbi:hypothetical protein HK096_008806, partial [Nowakowskiella sp. JEL0078]